MKIENNRIVEATESELFSLYLSEAYDGFMDFHEYKQRMESSGCVVIEEE